MVTTKKESKMIADLSESKKPIIIFSTFNDSDSYETNLKRTHDTILFLESNDFKYKKVIGIENKKIESDQSKSYHKTFLDILNTDNLDFIDSKYLDKKLPKYSLSSFKSVYEIMFVVELDHEIIIKEHSDNFIGEVTKSFFSLYEYLHHKKELSGFLYCIENTSMDRLVFSINFKDTTFCSYIDHEYEEEDFLALYPFKPSGKLKHIRNDNSLMYDAVLFDPKYNRYFTVT